MKKKILVFFLAVVMVLSLASFASADYSIVVYNGNSAIAYTLEEAIEKAPEGDTIILVGGFSLTNPVEIKKNLTINLNGKTLTGNGGTTFVIVDGKTLTIDGTEPGSKCENVRFNVGKTGSEGNLVLNGGTYTIENNTVVHVNGDCQNSSVTINGATIESTNDNGIQLNGKGTHTIKNSTISGATGVYIKAGNVTIENSKIYGTMETKANYVFSRNGSNATGDAIVVDSCEYPGGAPVVEIKGSETEISATAVGAAALGAYQYDGNEDGTIALVPQVTLASDVTNAVPAREGYNWAADGTLVPETPTLLAGASVVLDKETAVRVYINGDATTVSDYTFTWKLAKAKDVNYKDDGLNDDGKTDIKPTDETIVTYDKMARTIADGETYYYFDIPVCPRQFADTITITVKQDNTTVDEIKYSVQKYCENKLAGTKDKKAELDAERLEAYSEHKDFEHYDEYIEVTNLRKLMFALLDYGTAMQIHKEYKLGDVDAVLYGKDFTVNKGVANYNVVRDAVLEVWDKETGEYTPTYVTDTEAYEYGAFTSFISTINAEWPSYNAFGAGGSALNDALQNDVAGMHIMVYGTSVSLEDDIKPVFYFVVASSGYGGGAWSSLNDEYQFTQEGFEGELGQTAISANGVRIIKVKAYGQPANALKTPVKITVYNEATEKSATVKYNIMDYFADMVKDNESEPDLKNVCYAANAYRVAAEAVFPAYN